MNDELRMSKSELIRLRDNAANDGLRRAFRYAINRIETLEGQLREIDVMAKSIRRITQEKADA